MVLSPIRRLRENTRAGFPTPPCILSSRDHGSLVRRHGHAHVCTSSLPAMRRWAAASSASQRRPSAARSGRRRRRRRRRQRAVAVLSRPGLDRTPFMRGTSPAAHPRHVDPSRPNAHNFRGNRRLACCYVSFSKNMILTFYVRVFPVRLSVVNLADVSTVVAGK